MTLVLVSVYEKSPIIQFPAIGTITIYRIFKNIVWVIFSCSYCTPAQSIIIFSQPQAYPPTGVNVNPVLSYGRNRKNPRYMVIVPWAQFPRLYTATGHCCNNNDDNCSGQDRMFPGPVSNVMELILPSSLCFSSAFSFFPCLEGGGGAHVYTRM